MSKDNSLSGVGEMFGLLFLVGKTIFNEIQKNKNLEESKRNTISEQLFKYKKNKDYLNYIYFLIDHENELKDIEKYSYEAIEIILEIVEELEKQKNLEKAILILDEILNINNINNIIRANCLNIQGNLLLGISQDNKVEAFEKFYSALEIFPNDKNNCENIEKSFPYSTNISEMEIYINKVYKYKNNFSGNFLSTLAFFEMIISFKKEDYTKAYDIGLIHINKVYELFKNEKESMKSIINVFIISGSEVYSNYIFKKDLNSGEKIYNLVYQNLRDEKDKDKAKMMFGNTLYISGEYNLAFSKFNSISEIPEKQKLVGYCYREFIKDNLKKNINFEKSIEYINILKSLNIDDENLEKDILYLDSLIFIRKCEVEFENNEFSSSEEIEKKLKHETDITKQKDKNLKD